MKTYAAELKRRREAAGLTVRALGDRIERSGTFVTDFELAKKSNPPEPAMMTRLASALGWPVGDQLRAWGYPVESGPVVMENPFPPEDIRHRVVEAMKAVDMTGPDRAFWISHFTVELWMHRDMEAGLRDNLDHELKERSEVINGLADSDYGGGIDDNHVAS